MRRLVIIFLSILVVVGLGCAGVFAWRNLRGLRPVITKPPVPITKVINTTGMPLKLPGGFGIEIFAKNLPGARVMAFDGQKNMWVSQTGQGTISLLSLTDDKVTEQGVIFKNLRNPHGLAFDRENHYELYFAEEDKIMRSCVYCDGSPQKVTDLPAGGSHFSRTIGFGPDDKLYVSIGSTCNVCNEKDERRTTILSMDKDPATPEIFARGLRNSVFFAWHPETRELFATEMARDLLGDDIPPDEINIIKEGKNYGWPTCYGKNIHDITFDKNVYVRDPCSDMIASHIDIPAHSAPLGLAFIPAGSSWPEEYWNDLLVAYHGSWNRSTPTGYKVVRMKLDEDGEYEGVEDFISGWLTAGNSALGRPVDLVFKGDELFISDDKAGVIYKVAPVKGAATK